MSFGGGFGGNSGGFGFGNTNNNNTNTTSAGSLFGGNTATSGGFGGSGGFGSNNANANPFGAVKTGFGAATTSSSPFGANTSTTGGFGGTGTFGNNNATAGATLSTGFGGGNTGGLFGAKPATTGFGSTANTGGGLFGGTSSGGFGASNTTNSNPFGATNNTTNTFGANASTATGFGAGTTNNTFGGFGGGASNTNQGTAATPFNAVTEKDGPASATSSAYQSITMQPPYQGKSFEELRLEDYAQNRRLPQNNSFGASSTFGGFGSNNTTNTQARPTLFGATNNSTSGFGTSAGNAFGGGSNTGFGANAANNNNNTTGGGLFGAKPAGTGLFGATNTNTTGGFGTNNNAGGGLFGNNNNNNNAATNTNSAFGGFGNNTNNTTTSTGLFGGNTTANKPAFGGFGANNNSTTPSTGFGFGNNANANVTQSNAFGNNSSAGAFGANSGGSLFGNNNANKPATGGLFGSTNTNTTGGGLFGANTNTTNNAFGSSTGGGLFGSNTNANNNTGSVFGGAKPAGTGLFGAPAANNNTSLFGGQNNSTGGGLFGSNTNTNNTGGGLFGQAKPASNSLFGGNTGTSLFQNNNNNNNNGSGNSLFGNSQPANNSLFGNSQTQNNSSLFGNSQNQQPNQLTATIAGDPYGNAQLFASLAAPSPPVGPLATPLTGAKPASKARASLLASVRGGSPMLGASTTLTPRGRQGYGFSYSNYNSPAAATPILTPGAANLLRPTGSLGSTLSSRLSKSFSTSNLRSDSADGQSLVRTPGGQGSLLLSSGSLGSGSIRRLKIDRSLRTDLFGDKTPKQNESSKEAEKEPELRKRVSFDKSAEKDAADVQPSAANALVVHDENATPSKAPEMSQINSASALTPVPEENSDKSQSASSPRRPVEGGDYFTEPSIKQLKSMSRGQLGNVKTFTVGREGVGKIVFGRNNEVDLSSVVLDDICGKIVQLKPRSATVYVDDKDKPAVGRDLNVPSTIYLEQSWPRSTRHSSTAPQKTTTQKDIEKHKNRLKRVGGTNFLDYDDKTGVWSFTVEHFTTYEYDEEDETTMQDATAADAQPDSNAVNTAEIEEAGRSFASEMDSPDFEDRDDTFSFKLAKRSQQSNLSLPGSFENSMPNPATEYDDASADQMQEDHFVQTGGLGDSGMADPFIEEAGAVQPPSPNTIARYHNDDQDADMVDQDLPGSYHAEPGALKSILKQKTFEESLFGPVDNLADMPWQEQLQRTLSPKKRDRQALRDAQSTRYVEPEADTLLKKSLLTRSQLGQSHLAIKSAKRATAEEKLQSAAFETSMDIMRSLWSDEKQASGRGNALNQKSILIKRAHPTVNGTTDDFHDSFKPSFTNDDTLIFAVPGGATKKTSKMTIPLKPVIGGSRNVKTYKPQLDPNLDSPALDVQQSRASTSIETLETEAMEEDGVPMAFTSSKILFAELADSIESVLDREATVWKLCSILFDPLEVCVTHLVENMDLPTITEYQHRLRKDALLELWTGIILEHTRQSLQQARTAEEQAICMLCIGKVNEASQILHDAKNPRLAVMVSQLPGSTPNREIIKQQIQVWRERKEWSEFSDGQRTLYSILAGSTSLVQGVTGAAEDKVADFCMSEKFGLTWQQAFALKLRYAGHEQISKVVDEYLTELAENIERVQPLSPHDTGAEDILLSILKITNGQIDPKELLDPVAVSGNPFYHRLTWQLAILLAAKGIARLDNDDVDALTVGLAAEQECAGLFMDAIWTLLHLHDNEAREVAVRDVLNRNCSKIPDPMTDGSRGNFEFIVGDLLVPDAIVWSAKALYAQSALGNPLLQCEYLLHAGTNDSFDEAHNVLCRQIGPTAIIEQYYDDLARIVAQFEELGTIRFRGWNTGGHIYADLCQLVALPAARSHGREAESLLKKLDKGLEAQQQDYKRGVTLEMLVARIELRKMVNTRAKQLEDAEQWLSSVTANAEQSNKGNALLHKYMSALGKVY